MIGECFRWTKETEFLHTTECHTSVLGIREYALKFGSHVRAVPMDELGRVLAACSNSPPSQKPGLLAFPAECNFSGNRLDLDIVRQARAQGWYVVLDAAKYVSTSPLDLSAVSADFVAISFYKMFGFPTGLGALIVRNESFGVLQRTYFGGGTLAAAASESFSSADHTAPFHQLVDSPSRRFEDGTINFLSIQAIPFGLELLQTIGMDRISNHVRSLSRSLSLQLRDMRHRDGITPGVASPVVSAPITAADVSAAPVCVVYGRLGEGSIVTFNILRTDGTFVGYTHVSTAAASCGIQLRTGCFCNPGACQIHLRMEDGEAQRNYEAGHVCSDDIDTVDGRITGAVRVSFGYTSTKKDVDAIVQMVRAHFQQDMLYAGKNPLVLSSSSSSSPSPSSSSSSSSSSTVQSSTMPPLSLLSLSSSSSSSSFSSSPSSSSTFTSATFIRSVHIYPIKSCGGIHLTAVGDRWSFGNSGLQYDREWAVVAPSPSVARGSHVWRVLRQKDCPELCMVHTLIDWKGDNGRGELVVTCQSYPPLRIKLTRRTIPNEATKKVEDVTSSHTKTHARFSGANTGTGSIEEVGTMDLLICGRRCANLDARDILSSSDSEVNVWFTTVLKKTCRLVRMPPVGENILNSALQQRNGGVGFSNEQQLLLINAASVEDLQTKLRHIRSTTGVVAPMVTALSFRPNIVVDGIAPFEENSWVEGGALVMMKNETHEQCSTACHLDISKACVRCSMVNRDPTTGGSIPDVLHSLSTCYFKDGGTVKFGRYLRVRKETPRMVLEVGSQCSVEGR